MRGATDSISVNGLTQAISIHAPHAGRDSTTTATRREAYISIHAPHAGRDRYADAWDDMRREFQSTRPMRGATPFERCVYPALKISIHAPHAGRDQVNSYRVRLSSYFNPRAPCGARLGVNAPIMPVPIPSPAPQGGRDRRRSRSRSSKTNFNPRAPCGARPPPNTPLRSASHFNPRAPCGARLNPDIVAIDIDGISIHAPHAGRDPPHPWPLPVQQFLFQSTRPMRGATWRPRFRPPPL